jgi:hypothetical protein
MLLVSLGCGDRGSPSQPTAVPPVPPPEAFVLSGSVADTAFRSLAGSRVEVIAGSGVGTFTTTDERGRFSMPATFTDTVTIRASRDGYLPETHTVPPPYALPPRPTGEVRHWDVYLTLQPGGLSANLAGAYSLTLSADSACTSWPEEVRTRTYTATLAPGSRPTTFSGTLSDARIVPIPVWAPYFEIGVANDFAAVSLSFVEQLSDGTYLAVEGGAATSVGPSGITAPFNAHFVRCRHQPAMAPGEYWWCGAAVQGDECASGNNRLTLVRR